MKRFWVSIDSEHDMAEFIEALRLGQEAVMASRAIPENEAVHAAMRLSMLRINVVAERMILTANSRQGETAGGDYEESQQ